MRVTRNSMKSNGDGDEVAVAVAVPVSSVPEELVPAVKAVATYTAPDFSLFFIAFFALVTYCHETYYLQSIVLIGAWAALQMVSLGLEEDFQSNLFWNAFALLGNLLFYLLLGYCWSMVKLYLDIWQGHLSPALMNSIRTSLANGAIGTVLLEMKWNIMRWMITWPASLVYTMSRDPLRIITELLFEWSKQRYIYIISSALQRHDQMEEIPVSWTSVGIGFLYFLAYALIGFIWTHAKLFIDVWQGALPASMERELHEVYERKASYAAFALRIKWLVFQWMVTWPFSIVYTILRHPCRIIADAIYELSQRRLIFLIRTAMDLRHNKKE